jgi:hypothetical protein
MRFRSVYITVARLALVGAVLLAAAASATQNQGTPVAGNTTAPPPTQQMAPSATLGLWKSSFGAVKIEDDLSRGQPGSGALMGVWVYDRGGQEVIGYFAGTLNGNVLDFTWQEPADPAPLQGAGYLVFEPDGSRYSGRWWTNARDRSGEWTGWRAEAQAAPPPVDDGYGGATYGDTGGEPPPEGEPDTGGYDDIWDD